MDYITAGYPKSACRGVDLVLDTRETLTTSKVFFGGTSSASQVADRKMNRLEHLKES